MNTFFMSTCRTILVRGGINLFILSILAIGLFSVPQQSFAASLNRTSASTVANSFSVFCHFYYYDGQDTTPLQDTQACQQGSKAFGRLLTSLAGHNANMWPVVSLHALAQKNLINVQGKQDFFNAITDPCLQALLDPNNDKDFLTTLWDYNSRDNPSSTNTFRPRSNSTNLRCQTISISGLSSINACKVANNFCEVNDTKCPNSSDTTDCNNTSGNCTVYIVKPGLRNRTNCSGSAWDVTNGSSSQALMNYRAQVTGSSSGTCHEAFWFSPAQDGSTCQISMWIPDSADARIHFTLHSTSTSTPIKTNVDESDSSIQNSWMTVSPDGGVVMNRGAWSDYVYLSDAIHDNASSIVVSVAKFVCTN